MRAALWVAAIVMLGALTLVVGRAAGLLDIGATGRLRPPNVSVETEGGELPRIAFETAKLGVGAKSVTVDVPKLEVGERQIGVKLPTIEIARAGADRERAEE